MPSIIQFPDAELVLVNAIRAELTARGQTMQVGTNVPNPRPSTFVRVERVGGTRLLVVADDPMLTVECWAASDKAAQDLAQLVRGIVHSLPGGTHSGVPVYRVNEVGGPQHLPDPLSEQPRFLFTVQIAMRGVAA